MMYTHLGRAFLVGALAAGLTVSLPGAARAGDAAPQVEEDDWHEIAPNLVFGGSFRKRVEVHDDFGFGAGASNDVDFLLTQLRLNLTWTPTENLLAYIEVQDARIIGEGPALNENATPNIFSDSFDLHQFYADWTGAVSDQDLRVRVGRQKLNFGDQRLVGALEWVNTARVFDAVRVTVGTPGERTLDGFVSRIVPVNPNGFNDWDQTGNRGFDSDFHGLYYSDSVLIEDGLFEAYYLLRNNDAVMDEVHTIGGRYVRDYGAWDANMDVAGQFGDYGGMNHRAYALHLEAGYTCEEWYNARASAAYNLGSGDDNPADGTHETFDNLFPTNHKFYGMMDFFSLQNLHNLELALRVPVLSEYKGWVRVAYQGFWLAEEDTDAWYNAGGGAIRTAGMNVDPYVGSEIDITAGGVVNVLNRPVTVQAGYGHLFTGNFVSQTGTSSDANFFYLMSKIPI